MNAKMVFTVPIENIPVEVNKLIQNIAERLKKSIEDLSSCSYNDNYPFVIEQIDMIRKDLNLIDMNLDDSYNILLGYVKYQTDKRIKETKISEEDKTNE